MFDDNEIPVSARKLRACSRWDRSSLRGRADLKNQDFYCVHCRSYVSARYLLAGVHYRNHCPYCLWSRHMDLHQSGDRLSACKAGMVPIGLTLKRQPKKYPSDHQGELMLVHQCIDCAHVSINRIAADDDSDRILSIYWDSFSMSESIARRLEKEGIQILEESHRNLADLRLFGKN